MSRQITRRAFLPIVAAGVAGALQSHTQEPSGMASRGIKPQPRGKPSGLPFHAHFADVASSAGLRTPIIYGPADRMNYILESMGCGVAFLDYDNDGWLDILLLSGTRREGPVPGATNRLYRNNRDGTFTDVTDTAGLLHPGKRWGSGCTWVDYNRDGHLDLLVSNYLVFDFEKVPAAGSTPNCDFKGVPVNCGPRGLAPERPILYRNNGNGTFTDVTEQSGIGRATPRFGLDAVAADLDSDGWQEIYIACDSTPSLMFHHRGEGTFEERGLESGLAVSADGNEQAGMGIAIGDFGLDGRLGALKTHFAEDTAALYKNFGHLAFEEVTQRSGMGVETRYVSWGDGIADFDNDGLPDLFWVTGSTFPEVEKQHPEFPHKSPRVLFRNLGNGRFEELLDASGPGISEAHCSRGVAFGDFDNDGDVDILIMNMNEPPSLLRNDVSGGGRWLKVKLIGTKSNASAIGAVVTAAYGEKRQAQAVLAASGYLSCGDRRLHFGLGAAATADIEILWPSGIREAFKALPADNLVTIKEGVGVMRRERFGK